MHPSSVFPLPIIRLVGSSLSQHAHSREIIQDVTAPLELGYVESKFHAELILEHAAQKFPNLNFSIARVGQVAGLIGSSGIWNKQEWIPSLVTSSQHLGIIFETLGSEKSSFIDWVPIDLLAGIVVDSLLARRWTTGEHVGAKAYHPINPKPTTWNALLPNIIDTLSRGKITIQTVPFTTWLQRVRAEAQKINRSGDSELEKMLEFNPAIKLLSFYEGLTDKQLPIFEVESAAEVSDLLRQLQGVKPQWIKRWVEGWVGEGSDISRTAVAKESVFSAVKHFLLLNSQ